jgi:ComF family protein
VLLSSLTTLRDALVSLAYPANCRLCGNSIESMDDGVACARCWNDTTLTVLFDRRRICAKCGAPLEAPWSSSPWAGSVNGSPVDPGDHAGGPAPACAWCEDSPLTAARACGSYSGAIEASILFLKAHPHLCKRLRRIVESTCLRSATALACTMVAPIPLHQSRQRERGFNQANLIAALVSKAYALPMEPGLISRSKQTTRHRAGMDSEDRARSVERAFIAKYDRRIAGASILLVDDLYTTGATLNEAASVLLKAGATTVKAFTLARANIPIYKRSFAQGK